MGLVIGSLLYCCTVYASIYEYSVYVHSASSDDDAVVSNHTENVHGQSGKQQHAERDTPNNIGRV